MQPINLIGLDIIVNQICIVKNYLKKCGELFTEDRHQRTLVVHMFSMQPAANPHNLKLPPIIMSLHICHWNNLLFNI